VLTGLTAAVARETSERAIDEMRTAGITIDA
jgi:hypothetical protein